MRIIGRKKKWEEKIYWYRKERKGNKSLRYKKLLSKNQSNNPQFFTLLYTALQNSVMLVKANDISGRIQHFLFYIKY